jgi:hypothetical protein
MEIDLRISSCMDDVPDDKKRRESKSIRMPKDFRQLAEYNLGDWITTRGKDGNIISLVVEPAYGDDVKRDSLRAYLTSENHKLITGKSSDGTANVDLVEGITLGCDPELMVIDRNKGTMVAANNFLGLTKNGPLGFDGLLLEYRPSPSIDETIVIDNIYNLILKSRQHLNTCTQFPNLMLAGISAFNGACAVATNVKTHQPVMRPAVKSTAGFHLHYGLPPQILGYQQRFVAQQVVKALDYYVGIPSIIPEGSEDSYRRTALGMEYGKPGQFRLDHRTLEYRTPGASLMKHPILAQGLIGLGAVVMEDIVSRIKVITSNFTKLNEATNDADIRILYPNIPPINGIFGAICSPTTDMAKRHLDTIRIGIENMVGYARRAQSINNFFDNIETKFPYDVEENWRRIHNHVEK